MQNPDFDNFNFVSHNPNIENHSDFWKSGICQIFEKSRFSNCYNASHNLTVQDSTIFYPVAEYWDKRIGTSTVLFFPNVKLDWNNTQMP